MTFLPPVEYDKLIYCKKGLDPDNNISFERPKLMHCTIHFKSEIKILG